MGSWREYFFSMIVCSLSCGIVSQIISDTKQKELIHLICGMVMTLVIVRPLTGLELESILQFPLQNLDSADWYIAEGEKTASETLERSIKEACETYILDKAKTLGAEIIMHVTLNKELVPVFAEISGDFDSATKVQLQQILTTDLGIPKENQKWIWNQESNSS